MELGKKLLWPSDPGYQNALSDAVWNGRKPTREPAAIVLAETAEDVCAAVKLAKERDLMVSVRAGGHSFSAAGIREGAVLVDVSRLTAIDVDVAGRRAVVGPGVHGGDLNLAIEPHGLFFPSGHCPTVALGGFLLGGGMGWNFQDMGWGCMSVEAVDVVTADGELVRADENQNSDILWAARGSGPGFFGVITAYHLKLHQARAITVTVHNYPLSVRAELLTWLHDRRHDFPQIAETALYVTEHSTRSTSGPTMLLSTFGFGQTEEESIDALRIMDSSPVLDHVLWKHDNAPQSVQDLTEIPEGLYEKGFRYATDNMISNSPAAELVPAMEELLTTLPTPRSHASWINMARCRELPDMAFSLQGDTYVEAYSVWEDPSQDQQMHQWAVDMMRKLEPVAVGSQMSCENMIGRGLTPSSFLSAHAVTRLEQLRTVHDPEGRFASYLLA
ncbi:FAD-binding oxidoreductase [Streptomyces griseiscabiei]|uniref:FAD-binding oxidoreductase n=1 Tax=Streptomyces griseiscabiei TaxID=2993540 RepID=A0ABU4LHB8_9ACTN|nr:FAD-binding oxidoreductase [Streptomyces griseiscabiei]MBZ3900406.1 FAD-binding oxidoreductase [Streptomyces griseiscabiei]MDX2914574.1 FAD-binding oxidoreductase [Streptomyces griseiscabiei]